ncbi:hypothetical protein FRC04_005730 [Tulasnella sp. 424]|nr:hypothetical protein FRC04_005730 [Tulasnella sp. 424]KAG8977522.1 hypothetical protein FRC05_001380 [Tulasnella sp. 425]
MRALVLAVFGWASAVAANFHNVDVYPGSGDDEISVDGVYNTTINRCNCDVTGIPTGGSGRICHFPWLAKDGLDPTLEHTLSLMLVGPTLAENPSGNVIAELRSIRYTVPNQSSSVDASPTDDDGGDDEDEPTSSTAVPTPSITAENADAPLPQLASLHLSTAATCGVIIGIVLFFLLALVACLVLRRRSQQRKRRQQQAATMANVMAGPRSGIVSQGRARYPTEHLSWSPAAERLEARVQQQASSQSGKRGSVGSNGRSSWGSGSVGRHGGRRSRMDSIPEADWEHSDQRMATTPANEEKGGFSWASGSGASLPPSSPTGSETRDRERRASERAVYTSSDAVPSTARMTFPSIAAAGDYWNRRTSRGSGRFSALPPSPLRTSLVAGDDDDRLRPAS